MEQTSGDPSSLYIELGCATLGPPGLIAGLLLGWKALPSVLLGGVTYVLSSGSVAKVLAELGAIVRPEKAHQVTACRGRESPRRNTLEQTLAGQLFSN
jgi:hypothetical protein